MRFAYYSVFLDPLKDIPAIYERDLLPWRLDEMPLYHSRVILPL